MKLVSLNAWGASQGQVFFDYIKKLAGSTDIFCLQEIFTAKSPALKISSGGHMYLFEELSELLSEFAGFFCTRSKGFDFDGAVDFPVEHGLAVFVNKNINIISNTDLSLEPGGEDPVEGETKTQVFRFSYEGKEFSVINYHGPAMPGDKLDTPKRLANSQVLKKIWNELPPEPKILCGDFNLMPEIESIKILEQAGLINLIKEFNVTNTRNEISWNKHNNKQSFADYMFVSPKVKVNSFEVPYNLASDHLPMILDFNL